MWQLSTTFWFRVPLLQKQSISHRISTDRSFQFPLCVKGTTPLPTCRHNVIFRVSWHYTLRFPSSAYVLNSLSRFINRTKRFPPFGYACLSVELLQSSIVDCIVRCRRLYSPLQQTVQSIIVDCNNLPFKRPWPTLRNGLLFPWFTIRYKEIKQWFKSPRKQCGSIFPQIRPDRHGKHYDLLKAAKP